MSSTRILKRMGLVISGAMVGAALEGAPAALSGLIGQAIMQANNMDDFDGDIARTVGIGGLIDGAVEGAIMGYSIDLDDPSSPSTILFNIFSRATSPGSSLFTAMQLVHALAGYGFLVSNIKVPTLGGTIASTTLGATILNVPFAIARLCCCKKPDREDQLVTTNAYRR